MPTDIENNTGSHVTVSGTGPFTVGAALKYNRSISAVLADTDVRTFFAIDRDGTDFMLFVGTYTAAGTTVAVGQVINSSNADALVDWTGATVELMVVASVDEILGDQTEISDLDAASTPQGDELIPGLQGGLARKFTTQQLSPPAIVQQQGYNRRRMQEFCNFMRVSASAVYTTDGDLFGSEPVRVIIANSGEVDYQDFIFNFGIARCSTKTNAAGRAGVLSALRPVFIDTAASITRFGIYAGIDAIPTTTTNEFICRIGWLRELTADPTDGLYFQASEANANWQAVAISSTAGETVIDTAVPIVAANIFGQNFSTFELVYNHNDDEMKFFIDGIEVATVADTHADWPGNLANNLAAVISNDGSTDDNILWVDSMKAEAELDGAGDGMSTGKL